MDNIDIRNKTSKQDNVGNKTSKNMKYRAKNFHLSLSSLSRNDKSLIRNSSLPHVQQTNKCR